MIFTKLKYLIVVYSFLGEVLLLIMADTIMQKCIHMSNLNNKTVDELFLFLCRRFGIEELRITARIE